MRALERRRKEIVDRVVKLAEADDVEAISVIRDNVFSVVEAIVKLAEEGTLI